MRISLAQYWELLVKYLKPQRLQVLLLTLLLLSNIGLQLVNPQILRYFIDTARAGNPLEVLSRAAFLFIGVVLVDQFIFALATYLSAVVGWTATNQLRADLALHCLRLDLSFHKMRPPGELIERIDGDVTILSNFFSQFVIRIVGNLLLLVGVLGLLFHEDWRVGLAMTGIVALTLYLLRRIRDTAAHSFKAFRQAMTEIVGFWQEWLSGTDDIRANGAKAYVMRRLYQLMRILMQYGRKAMMLDRMAWNTFEVSLTLGNAVVFMLGALLLNTRAITIGTVYLVYNYVSLIFLNLGEISQQIEDLQRATACIERIAALYHVQSHIEDGQDARLPEGPLAVELDGVSFRYVEGTSVLQDISLRLEPGKTLGVLGRTGSGKTSLIRLLFRFYDPDRGMIRLGDVDIRQVRLAHLRERIGMVTQEVQLFHASVRDNLTFFDEGISDEQILQVLHDLELDEWYRSLPQGLNTELASGADSLSAGQAQLLALARVFLKNPGLVILDEASSRLDPATEQLIERAMVKLLKNRTGIIIAHRLGTVQHVDHIIILEEGGICEQGAREQLMMDSRSRFYSLLQTEWVEAFA